MNKEIIHFAHANGFPAQTYNKLFSYLADDYEIGFLERHAHDPQFPVTDGWDFLVDELVAEIRKNYSQKIIGVGHSLGGILHLLAAVKNPELYKALVLLDAPIISRVSGAGLRILKKFGLIDRLSPSRATKFRRSSWRSKSEALEHFGAKKKFQSFDEDVLRDYVEYGTIKDRENMKLFFDPRIEAEIYRTIPDDLAKLRGKLKIPAAYVGGTKSLEAKLARLGFMRRNFSVDFYLITGTHLFPLEKPQQTAAAIKQALSKLK